MDEFQTRWWLPVISWFINHSKYRDITYKPKLSPVSYWSYVHQLSDSELGHHLVLYFLLYRNIFLGELDLSRDPQNGCSAQDMA